MFSSLPVHSMSSSCFLSFLLIVLGLSAAYIYIYIFALSSELDGLTIFYYYLLLLLFFPEALQLIGKELKFPSPFLPGPAASRNVMHLDEQTEITGKGQIYCKSISWPRPQCRHLEGKSDTKVPFWIQS